jgi:hypothetical protein
MTVLSRRDLVDGENLKQAEHELRRAGEDQALLLAWVRDWGGASVNALRALHGEVGTRRLAQLLGSRLGPR